MEKRTQFNFWYAILALFAVIVIHDLWRQVRQVEPIAYSEFKQLLKEGRVAEVTVRGQHIHGKLKEPRADERAQFLTTRVETDLARDLAQYDVQFRGVVESTFLREILSWVVPALVFVGIWFWLSKRIAEKGGLGGGFMSLGKSKAKVYLETEVKVRFDSVAGVDEAKQELQEVVGFLRDPARYGRLGGRAPRGILLVGPPGTGKTLLARAVAGEAGVPFFSISGSDFVEMFVGVGAARVRDLFEQARGKAPAIIFIDELDALGRARGAYAAGGHDEKEQTLNQLLVEMDGFDTSSGLVLLAATNRPEILDPALLRAGRFDRQVLVDRPDKAGRTAILKVHVATIRLAPGLDLDQVASLTPGFSGAELANLVNEAALLATRRNAEAVTLDDFTGAVERIVAGLEKKNRVLNPHERRIVAYHELGHAMVALALPGSDPVHKISIIPRGIGALGYTIQRPTEDRFLMTREELENKMAVLLGGRAAEWVVFGHLSTGAADDIAKTTDIARNMVMRFGMDDALGHVAYESGRPGLLGVPATAFAERTYSDMTASAIDRAVRALVEQALERAVAILSRHRVLLDSSAVTLLERETMNESDIAAIKQAMGADRGAHAPEAETHSISQLQTA